MPSPHIVSDAYIVTEDGQLVSEKIERLARVVQDYDPCLEVRWIPPQHRVRDDKAPYQIIERAHNGDHLVFHFTDQDDPADVLARLFMGDNKQGNVLDRIEKREIAEKILKQREYLDAVEEAVDRGEFLLRSNKNYVHMGRDEEGKLIKLDDTRRRI